MSLAAGLVAYVLLQAAPGSPTVEPARQCAIALGALRLAARGAGETEDEARWNAAARSYAQRVVQATPDRRGGDILIELGMAGLERLQDAMAAGSLRSLHQEALACEAALAPPPT
ncbi:MAG: hypothetical protein EON85_09055 [Brevundimonas sp.]|nr:MAG: hypothetical protein EON85_09055 [Brevundimonas sp.]